MCKKTIILIAFVSMAVSAGCSYRLGDFTALSTKNIYCKDVDLTKLEQHRGVEGEDVRFLGIGANAKDAADRAMEQHDGNLLIDAVIYSESSFLLFGGYRVRGTVIKVPYK